MSTQSQITQTQVLDAIRRAALMLERQDAAQSGLQLLLDEFRRSFRRADKPPRRYCITAKLRATYYNIRAIIQIASRRYHHY
ncbi:hypothetical protein IMAU20009_02461 [Lactiplantibacillus plantarum]|nr:hypothetical protein [Lactiplantibacillus plantarum]MCG0863184.1 hypothetical protein [Lactiplantibacillus plantarum]